MEEKQELKIGSLSDEKRRLAVELKIQAERYENEYTSCCSRSGTDKRLIDVGFKMTVLLIVLIHSLIMIAYNTIHDNPCDSFNPLYTSIITLIIGLFIPQPTLHQ